MRFITKLSYSVFLLFFTVFAQMSPKQFIGNWEGKLQIGGTTLKLVFHFSEDSLGGISGTLDSPDQAAFGMPIEKIELAANKITVTMTNIGAKFDGDLKENGLALNGEFAQGGMKLPLELKKVEKTQTKLNRPQEPQQPYPYKEVEVTIENVKDSVKLSGTLTLPEGKGPFTAVVLISGSGPQNRNEELLGHKPFLVIADYLTRNGIAVLRYDDRGIAKSTGDFSKATTFDFATDASAAVDFLSKRTDIAKNKIGLIGHSEGGLIAPIAANQNKKVGFIVLLAGPGLPGDEIIMLQSVLISRAEGVPENLINLESRTTKRMFEILKENTDTVKIKTEMKQIFEEYITALPDSEKSKPQNSLAYAEMQLNTFLSPWFQTFIRYNPVENLSKLQCPVLALNGSLDLQVPCKENLSVIQHSLEKANNKKSVVKELPGLNHLFQKAVTGAPSEYAKIEETIDKSALEELRMFITSMK